MLDTSESLHALVMLGITDSVKMRSMNDPTFMDTLGKIRCLATG